MHNIWIDATCIDQQNVTERGDQVAIMGSIYRQAETVLVWLGETIHSGDQIPLLFQSMQKQRGSDKFEHSHNSESLTTTARQICNFSYWKRTWIIQEIVLARSIVMICQVASIEWDEFWSGMDKMLIWRKLRDLCGDEKDLENSTAFQHRTNRIAYQSLLAKGPTRLKPPTAKMDMSAILSQYWETECTDFRDRIYALLSLVAKAEGFSVDYRESGPSLALRAYKHFQDANEEGRGVEFAMQLTKALGITYLDGLREHIQRQQCWPTELVRTLTIKTVLNLFIRVGFFLRPCPRQWCCSSGEDFEMVTWYFTSMPRTNSKTVHFQFMPSCTNESWPGMILKVEEDFCPPHCAALRPIAPMLHLFWSAETRRLFEPTYRVLHDAYTARTLLTSALHAMVQQYCNEQQPLRNMSRAKASSEQTYVRSHLEVEITPFSVRDPTRFHGDGECTISDAFFNRNVKTAKIEREDKSGNVLPFATFESWLASAKTFPEPGQLQFAV